MHKEREQFELTGGRDAAIELLFNNQPFRHRDLVLVTLSGSISSNSHGRKSDIDITTVLKPEDPKKVDGAAILTLAEQLRKFAFSFKLSNPLIHPVIISTIRLEEAQIAMAETEGKEVVPIHWLHYPSVEFASVNEPPGLFNGLINGRDLKGNSNGVLREFGLVQPSKFPELSGLDWLTDGFRVLVANINPDSEEHSFQPVSFLKNLAMHNLEYFWKWRVIAPLVEKEMLKPFVSWNDIASLRNDSTKDLADFANRVRDVRHQGVNADLNEIINLHLETFNLWPIR